MEDKTTYEEHDHRHVDDITRQETQDTFNQRHIANVTGVDSDTIDKSYWISPRFLGSVSAIVFVANSLFFGYAIPVNILNVINEDLGKHMWNRTLRYEMLIVEQVPQPTSRS